MKRLACVIFLGVTLLSAVPLQVHAGRARGHVGVNGGGHYSGHYRPAYRPGYRNHAWGGSRYWGPRVYWGGSIVLGPWYPYRYYAPPPVVIQEPPQVYAQPEQAEASYWYYCRNPEGYYPYVKACPEGWMKVVPDATPPN
jgi:hypothetical protein